MSCVARRGTGREDAYVREREPEPEQRGREPQLTALRHEGLRSPD